MDKEKVKEILDNFENDNFVDAKEILSQEIKVKIDKHIYNKTGVDLSEGDSTKNALGTLKAILNATKDDKNNDIFKMATGMKKYYDKEKSFSPDQAKWIWKTSVAMFKK